MRRYLITTMAMAVSVASLIAASSNVNQPQQFAGTWQARFQGSLICTIKVTAGPELAGALYGCSFQVNNDGDLLESEFDGNPDEPSPIQNLRVSGQTLSFEIDDGGDVMKFELVLIGEGQAELRFVAAPIKINPIRFEKLA